MKRYEKGQFGYRDYHKKIEMKKIIIGAFIIIAQLAARTLADSTFWKNILTVTAILSVLPVANAASPLLASWRFKTPPDLFYKKVVSYERKSRILYDLIITSKDALMPMDAVVIHPTGVYAYCTAKKLDMDKAERFFTDMFTGSKLEPSVKLIQDEKVFFNQLNHLEPVSEFEDKRTEDTITLLKSLSM